LILVTVLAACAGPAATPSPAPVTPGPSAPATPSPTTAPAFPAVITDDEGTSVTIAAEPQRIVTLTPAATETLFALGVGDRIVGKSEDILLYPPEAGAIPDVEKFDGSAVAVDIEKIVAAKPDLVIAGGNFGTPPDAVQRLRELGLPVVVVYAPSVAAVLDDIELLGAAVGRPDQAVAITQQMSDGFAAVETAVVGFTRPRVFYEIDATGAFYGPADDSFLAVMISMAGGEPVTTGSPDKYDISAERLLQVDPEVILLADAAYGVTAADVAGRPGWSTMTAVKAGDIRAIDDTTITRPGPRLFLGLELLASTIHPDAVMPSLSPVPPVP
jgi:iron complex transport system substrate-binding protein